MVIGGAMTEATAGGRDLAVDGGAMLAGMGLLVRFVSEVLKLYIKVIRVEDIAEVEKRAESIGVAAGIDQIAHLPVTTAGEADESSGVGPQGLEAYERRVLTFGIGEVGGGEEAAEIGITLAGLGEEDEMVRVVALVVRAVGGE